MEQNDENRRSPVFKFIVLGEASSGKTALIRRFCQNYFSEKNLVIEKKKYIKLNSLIPKEFNRPRSKC